MDNPSLQHLPMSLRNVQSPTTEDPMTMDVMSSDSSALTSHLPRGFPTNNSSAFQNFPTSIGDIDQSILHATNAFARPTSLENHQGALLGHRHLPQQQQSLTADQRMLQQLASNHEEAQIQFAIATSHGQLQALRNLTNSEQSDSLGQGDAAKRFSASSDHLDLLSSLQHDDQSHNNMAQSTPNGSEAIKKSNAGGHFSGMKLVPHPPDLQAWRERLFDVDDIITLTEEQFNVYFPHVDNVYSHRSTQKYKRKPFVSHYWDCRLKGRPSGTPKSDDPTKKKRKRTARERDLCDVKIKITEYFPGASISENDNEFAGLTGPITASSTAATPSSNHGTLPAGHPGTHGARYFTIQRVNGNGANGKPDGVGGGHRHTLEDSDRVKKSSVQRHLLLEGKNKKGNHVSRTSSFYIFLNIHFVLKS